eukprot:TCONS_00054742-protein
MSPRQRFKHLSSNNLCFQCLFPGALANTGRHRDGRCQHDFVCPHESHDQYPIKKHVLVCEEHKTNPQNEQLLNDFKARFIRNPNLPDCAKNIQLVHHVDIQPGDYHANANNQSEIAIYMLQQISINNQTYMSSSTIQGAATSSSAQRQPNALKTMQHSNPTNQSILVESVVYQPKHVEITLYAFQQPMAHQQLSLDHPWIESPTNYPQSTHFKRLTTI